MQPNVRAFCLALFVLSETAWADTQLGQQEPVVVYEGRSTISAGPFYQRIQGDDRKGGSTVTMPGATGDLALEDRLPLTTDHLSVGRPQMKTVPGLIKPLFIMGMDEVSLTWFSEAAQGLVDIGARGIVVQAGNKPDWLDLQSRARDSGIDLMLLEGDSLAQGYGITTYPVVLVDPVLAGEGAHE